MKSILISMPPKKVARLLDGSSRIIFVKSKVRYVSYPIDVYVYCTKDENLYYKEVWGPFGQDCYDQYEDLKDATPINGKVVAKFTLTNVERVYEDENGVGIFTDTLDDVMLYKLSGVDHDDLDDSEYDAEAGGRLHAWYAAWLEVLDVPMELSEFKRRITRKECIRCAYRDMISNPSASCRDCSEFALKPIKKAPSGWMYVETEGEQE